MKTKGVSRTERMKAIGAKLVELDPDLVGFQEAFIEEDRKTLISALEDSRLKYHQYYPSWMVGSGLLISSAYPIKEAFFHRYSVSNSWHKIKEGDFWAGKGAAMARIELPNQQGMIDFYDTHCQAGYGIKEYEKIKQQQLTELSQFVNQSHLPNSIAIVVGDMNCRINSQTFKTGTEKIDLERLMVIPSKIDHIFGVKTPLYLFGVQKSLEIVEHDDIRLSDHNGYLSEINILPAEKTQVR